MARSKKAAKADKPAVDMRTLCAGNPSGKDGKRCQLYRALSAIAAARDEKKPEKTKEEKK
jgi:hypothetical protein